MYNPYPYSTKATVDKNRRLDVTAIVQALRVELAQKTGLGRDWTHPNNQLGADTIKHYINEQPHNFECLIVPQHNSALQVDYIKSNLRGYVFYFICSGCERRVKYLYYAHSGEQLACRLCHRLSYKKKPDKYAEAKRLLRNPERLINYFNSTPNHREKAYEAIEFLKRYVEVIETSGLKKPNH